MKISKYTKSCILSSLLLGGSVNAMTLEESVISAMESNPIIKERLSNFKETQQDLNIANAEWLPKLDLISSVGVAEAGNLKSVVNDENYRYYTNSLKFTQNIFNGYSTTYKVQYQEARILAAAHHYVENVNDIAFQTVGAYLDVIRSYKLMQIAQESLEINQRIYEDVQELYKSGLTTSSEVTKIQSSLALARSNLMVQKNNTRDKHSRMKRLLGKDIALADMQLPKLNIPMPESQERATMIAIKNNPSILVSNYNIKGSQALYHESKSKFYPIINFEVEQMLNDSRKRDNTYERPDDRTRAAITLTWNFYNGGADKASKQKQISNIHKEIEIQRDLKRQVIEGLELSWSAYEMIQGQLTHLYDVKRFSEETMNNYLEEYELGRRTLLDLLSAQNDLTSAKIEITNAEFDRLFAQYRILDAMGILVETIMGDTSRYDKDMKPIQEPFTIQEDRLPVSKDANDDTIVDTIAICDNAPKGANLMPYGCEYKPKDSDFDGVPDNIDQCPNTPIGLVVNERGCPVKPLQYRFDNDPKMFLSTPKQYSDNSPKKAQSEGVYDYKYSFLVEQNVASKEIDNTLMYGDFKRIKRFAAIDMNGLSYDEAVDEIVAFYESIDHKNVIITVIGHSGTHDDAVTISQQYAQTISQMLVEKGIAEEKLYTQARADLDHAFLETYEEDRKLNNRVLVTIYQPLVGLIDSDGDGVPDYLDQCPNTPKGYTVDKKGCVLKIDLKVNFGNNSSVIEANGMKKVKEFARFLLDHPTYNTTIIGHTSIAGNESREYNIALSQRRAQSVKNALVGFGVIASRIKTVGKGPDMPIATNDSPEGRAQNRRIEATLQNTGNVQEQPNRIVSSGRKK